MWYYGVVERVEKRDDRMIEVDVRWSEEFIACGESDLIEELLRKHLWNPEKPEKGVWRQDAHGYLRIIE